MIYEGIGVQRATNVKELDNSREDAAGTPSVPEKIVENANEHSLRDLDLAIEYRSDAADLLREFYFPCLERSTSYQRAVGYFTTGGLAAAACGITALIANGGRMQLVASPLFEQDDLAAIEEGYEARENIIERALEYRPARPHELESQTWDSSSIPVDRREANEA